MKLVKDKKGQGFVILGIMIFIIAFFMIVEFIPVLKETTVRARSEPYLNCTDPSLDTGIKMTCVAVDFTMFAFVGVGIAAALAYIGYKKFVQQGG